MRANKKIKKRVYTVLIVCLPLVLLLLFAQLRSKSAVESFLERKIPAHIALEYDDLHVNLLAGKIQFSDILMRIRDRDTTLDHTFVEIGDVTINGFSYWQFFLRNSLKASEVSVTDPKISYFPSKTFRNASNEPKGVVNLLKPIAIGRITISNGVFNMAHPENDSTQVRAQAVNFILVNGKTDPETIKQKIPITYDNYDFSAEGIFVDLGAFETVRAGALAISETNAILSNLALQSKYSKEALSKVVQKEHDHIDLKVPEGRLENIDFGFRKNRFFFSSSYGEVDETSLNIYRDKLIADDHTVKKMYSTVLRELPFDLNIDSVAFVNSKLLYEENVENEVRAGSLFFDDLNLRLRNVSNSYEIGNQTLAEFEGKLMGVSPVSLSYSFDVNDTSDSFNATCTLYGLNGKLINPFLRPTMNAQIKGQVDELYFTTTGNRNTSVGDMKMKYKDLNFEILKKDRLRINKVLSAIGNLFINDGSNADAKGYRYGTIDVERDRTKSFFNYIWISTQDGLLSTLTGDGKKEED